MTPAVQLDAPPRAPRSWPIFLAVVALLVGLVLPPLIELWHEPSDAVGPFLRRENTVCSCRGAK